MDITVSSRNIELTSSLRSMAEEKIGRLTRFLDGIQRAEVHFYEEKNPRISEKDVCEVTIEGHGHHIRAKVAAGDPYAAVDGVVAKLEHQLHKVKTKMTARSHTKVWEVVGPGEIGSPDRLAPSEGSVEPAEEAAFAALDGFEDQRLSIVKVKSFSMAPITPDEAVEKMELLGHGFYFFSNISTGRSAVVYLRHDGSVGLIDEAAEVDG